MSSGWVEVSDSWREGYTSCVAQKVLLTRSAFFFFTLPL